MIKKRNVIRSKAEDSKVVVRRIGRGGEFPRTLLDQSTSCSRDMKLRMRSDLISAGGVTGFRGNHGLVSGIRQRYTVTR